MTLPATMQAAVHDRYGDPDVIHVDRRPVPVIADDEVLVRVAAASVDGLLARPTYGDSRGPMASYRPCQGVSILMSLTVVTVLMSRRHRAW